MMMPNAMATTRDGGSLFQGAVVRPQQEAAFMASQGVPTGNQAVNGLQDAARQALQANRTDYHGRVQEGLNFPGGPPEHEARNRANELARLHRMSILINVPELGGAPNLVELGRRLTQGMG
jgi:hypothetical protein